MQIVQINCFTEKDLTLCILLKSAYGKSRLDVEQLPGLLKYFFLEWARILIAIVTFCLSSFNSCSLHKRWTEILSVS